MSSDESDLLKDESDVDGYDYESSGTYSFCGFSLCFDNSVGHVSVLGYGIFVPLGVESKCDIFVFVLFELKGVDSNGGRLIKCFWRSKSLF